MKYSKRNICVVGFNRDFNDNFMSLGYKEIVRNEYSWKYQYLSRYPNIVLLDKKLLKGVVNIRSPIYVPYHSLNNRGLLKCIIPSKIEIENKFNENFLLGMMDDKIGINGVDCILNLEIMETLHD